MNTSVITIGYTIHNKSHLIPKVLSGLSGLNPSEFELLVLFDACTDDSLELFKKEIIKYPDITYRILVPTEELFEIKANNMILREAGTEVIALFQDDMVLQDPIFIDKVAHIVTEPIALGLVGGRMGFNITSKEFPEKIHDVYCSWSHKVDPAWKKIEYARYVIVPYLNRGPLIFTKSLIEKIGYLDESYYPLWGDDMDYCARCNKAGLSNIVFDCHIKSDLEWGTTRKGTKLNMKKIMRDNWQKFSERWL